MHREAAASDWWKTGVVYQVYPRSFADSNGDGVGDLAGITAHLDHLAGKPDSLGIDAIWLSPIYPSPDFDFGYDVADYVDVDPRYGTLADFDRFVDASHERGVKVILDLVLNHSSHLHPWFQASRQGRSGEHADWYIWADPAGRTRTGRRRPPNNWRSWFGGPAWTWDEARGQFYMHTFLPEQPDLNWRNPRVREALLGVVRFWLDRGVDGFRLDVFNVFFKDAALRSNPFRADGRTAWDRQQHVYDRDQPELVELLEELRAITDERPGRMTVGELFDGAVDDAVRLTSGGHLAFDFSLVLLPWSAGAFAEAMARREAAFGANWPTVVLSNHDQPRHAGRFEPAGRGRASAAGDARAKVAATFLLTSRGSPYLYYGEELALRNLSIPRRLALDPPARRPHFRWWNRDQARGPMSWSGEPGAGFTTGTPWLPLPPDAPSRNVATQSADPDSVLAFYRRLLVLRRETPVLRVGAQELLDLGDANVLTYVRRAGTDAALVLLNFAGSSAEVPVPAPTGRTWHLALTTAPRPPGTLGGDITLGPYEALVAVER